MRLLRTGIWCLLTALSGTASAQSGLAAFINGFMKGQQEQELSNLRRAETERAEAETRSLRAPPRSLQSDEKIAFQSGWQPHLKAQLLTLGRYVWPNGGWSDVSLALADAQVLSPHVIEVYQLNELSPEQASQLHASSAVRRSVVDCARDTVTSLSMGFYSMPGGLGEPSGVITEHKLLVAPFTGLNRDMFDKACDRLQEVRFHGMLVDFTREAKQRDGLDYANDAALRGEADALVRSFAAEAMNAGMQDKPDMAASKWALEQAEAEMVKRHQKPGPAAFTIR